MHTKMRSSYLLLILIVLIGSSLSGQAIDKPSVKNERLKYELVAGQKTTVYIYNPSGKISEVQSIHGYQKYHYNSKGLLQKEESAMDPSLLSSSRVVGTDRNKKMMTAENSKMDFYRTFEYNTIGKPTKIKHYASKQGGAFEHTSTTTLVYSNANIIRKNSCDNMGNVDQFTEFQYDNKGNVITEEYYVRSTKNAKPTLISRTFYKYDDKRNPSVIYRDRVRTLYDTNTNNVIESIHVLIGSADRQGQTSTTKTSYKYDAEGFPIEQNGRLQYQYE
jgi:YD repeat-containing protein